MGEATEAISTPTGNADKRDVESPITNAVAQMFHEVLGDGDAEFIGVQNPGGTRASFDAGEISYREAAMALPFANSLFVTELTGAGVKEMLEQQWQRNADGTVPSRPFLRLGLSDNITYTYDESRDEGDRILSIHVGGAPIDPARHYTLGSGSFLIGGGDQFHAFRDGVNTRDAGRVDLEAWVGWVGENSPLSPDYSKRGVSVQTSVSSDTVTFTLGELLGEGLADETLDMNLAASEGDLPVSPALANASIIATIGGSEAARGTVVDGGDHSLGLLVRAGRSAAEVMDEVNPVYIPRNHLVEEALAAGTESDLGPLEQLLEAVTDPFRERPGLERYAEPAPVDFGPYQTFCGT